jgi:hypothetical protein
MTSRHGTTRIIVLAFALALAGCSGGGESGAPATTTTGLGALLVGRLFGAPARRCMWVGTPTSGSQVAWPKRYRIAFRPARIEDRTGVVLARRGDWIRMGGGFVDTLPSDPGCPGGDQPGKWLPAGEIQFLDGKRPPEAPTGG